MKGKKIWFQLLRLLPLGLMVVMLCLLLFRSTRVDAGALVAVLPENPWLAGGVLLGLFVLKSLAITFPVALLWVVSGMLFPLPGAICLNLLGLLVGLSLSFFIGKFSGAAWMAHWMEKYPKLQKMMGLYRGKELFFSYILRYLPVPMDIASMLAGAISIPWWKFLLGGVLGLLPQLLAHTVLGTAVFQPGYPAFWGSLASMVLIGGVSLLFYGRVLLRERKNKL